MQVTLAKALKERSRLAGKLKRNLHVTPLSCLYWTREPDSNRCADYSERICSPLPSTTQPSRDVCCSRSPEGWKHRLPPSSSGAAAYSPGIGIPPTGQITKSNRRAKFPKRHKKPRKNFFSPQKSFSLLSMLYFSKVAVYYAMYKIL